MMKKFIVGAMVLSLLSSAGVMCFACEESDSASSEQEIMTLEEKDAEPVGEDQASDKEQERDECCEQRGDFGPRGSHGEMPPPPRHHHHNRGEMPPPPRGHHHHRHGEMPPPPHGHHHHREDGPMCDHFDHKKCPKCGYEFPRFGEQFDRVDTQDTAEASE